MVHGLSIPALDNAYRLCGVQSIADDAVQVRRKSVHVPTPGQRATRQLRRRVLLLPTTSSNRPVPNNRRTVLFNGKKIQGLPRYANEAGAGGAPGGRRPSATSERDIVCADVDPVEEEKIRAQQRAASIQRLG